MTAKSNIISFRAYAKQSARLTGPATSQDISEHHWDTDDLKRILFNEAGQTPVAKAVSWPKRIVWQ